MAAVVNSVLMSSPILAPTAALLAANTPLNRPSAGLRLLESEAGSVPQENLMITLDLGEAHCRDCEASRCSPACSFRSGDGGIGSSSSSSSGASFCEAPSPPSSFGEGLGSPNAHAGLADDLTVLDIDVDETLLYETLASDADLEQPAASPRPSAFTGREFPVKSVEEDLFTPLPPTTVEPAAPAFHSVEMMEAGLELVLGEEPLERKMQIEHEEEYSSDELEPAIFGRPAKRPRPAECVEMTFLDSDVVMEAGAVKPEPSEESSSVCGSPEEGMFLETSDGDTQEQLQALSSEISFMDDAARRLIAQALYRLSASAAPDPSDPSPSLEPLFSRSVAVAVAAAAAAASGLAMTGSGRKRRVAAATPCEQRALDAIADAHRRADRAVARITFLVDPDPDSLAPDSPSPPSPLPAPAVPPPAASPGPVLCPVASKPPTPGQPTPPRKRVFFTEDQVRKLNNYYEGLAGNKCTPVEIAAIASDVGLTEHQVRIYFQNKRARTRKPSGSGGCKTPVSSPPARAMASPPTMMPPSTPVSAAQSPAASPVPSPLTCGASPASLPLPPPSLARGAPVTVRVAVA